MPTPAFSALSDVYADWSYDTIPAKPMSFRTPNLNPNQSQIPKNQQQGYLSMNLPNLSPVPQQDPSSPSYNAMDGSETDGDIRSFCPNCSSALKANDILQQRIIEQNIWPRPQWVPQYPQAWVPYDPYNRYWANTTPVSTREDFGNIDFFGNMSSSPQTLLQIILFILVALFIIQLVECIYSKFPG